MPPDTSASRILMTIAPISCDSLKRLVDGDKGYALLDAREPGEYNAGHIPGATSLPRRDIEFRIRDLIPVRDTSVVIVGDGKQRENLAAATMSSVGYRNVQLLTGGVPAWSQAGYSLATGINLPSKEFGEKIHLECEVPEIEPQDLRTRLQRGDDLLIFDARTPAEYGHFCIPGGLNLPGGDLVLWAEELKKNPRTTVVINCAGRTRSIIGTQTLRRLGLSNVVALRNGTMGWLLAGLDLECHPNRRPWTPSDNSRAATEELAAKIAKEETIPYASITELRDLLNQRDQKTLYPIDVRSSEEYLAGHIPGFLSVPGGQAVQRADDYIAVGTGTIVFTCDRTARATMAAYWYRKMGFKNACALEGGIEGWANGGHELEIGQAVKPPLGIERAHSLVSFISCQELALWLTTSKNLLLLDVGLSAEYEQGHLPGSAWISRGWLEERIPQLYPDRQEPIAVVCPNGQQSTLAGAALTELGYSNVCIVEGGTRSWQDEGRPLETGLTKPLVAPNDIVLSTSMTGDKSAMRRYLDWELRLGDRYKNR